MRIDVPGERPAWITDPDIDERLSAYLGRVLTPGRIAEGDRALVC